MKRRGLIVLATATLLTLSAVTIDAHAEWEQKQSENTWIYTDTNGNRLTNTWKKGADNLWRYLDSYGKMAINTWIENTYYVDANGILVTDKWMKFQDSGNSQYKWYYFGSSGMAIMDNWSKINDKWYYFDGNGEMQTGWIQDDLYYSGTDGAMRTGWQKLLPPDSDYDPDRVTPGGNDDEKKWYYFYENGKKYFPKDMSGDYDTHKINGIYYCFNADGALQTGWKNVGSSNAENEIDNYKYYDNNGKLRVGWYSVEPPQDITGYEENVEWFYFSSSGVPKSGPQKGEASTSDLKKINGKNYLFNELGNPVYGLQKLKIGRSNEYTAFYFGDKKTSTMQTGKVKVTEGDGERCTYYFSRSGRGYTGVNRGYLYYKGKLQCAESGMKYEAIDLPTGNSTTTYVVNTSGRVAKGRTVKDADGVKYKTTNSGKLVSVDGGTVYDNISREPVEPTWQE